MAILLIGSTGNGKSSFGNFLLDPSEQHLFDKQTFETAQDNLPKTQSVMKETKVVKYSECQELEVTVIDTPGLNENPERDLEHMIQVVQELQDVKSVRACVIVVKFQNKVDQQYKDTIEYYRELLPSLFERNVIIVMPDFALDSRSVMIRKRNKINPDQVIAIAKQEIKKSAKLTYDPKIFSVNCQPIEGEDHEIAMEIRSAFLAYVAQLEPFSQESLTVAKTRHVLDIDQVRIAKIKEEISEQEIKHREKAQSSEAKKSLEAVEKLQKEITKLEQKKSASCSEKDQLDRSDSVVSVFWEATAGKQLLTAPERPYHLISTSKVKNFRRQIADNNGTWNDELMTEFEVKGVLKGKKFRRLDASITLEVEKREKYRDRIKDLKDEIEKYAKELESVKTGMEKAKERNLQRDKHQEAILEKFIAEKREAIKKLSKKYVTIPEAKTYLPELQKMSSS